MSSNKQGGRVDFNEETVVNNSGQQTAQQQPQFNPSGNMGYQPQQGSGNANEVLNRIFGGGNKLMNPGSQAVLDFIEQADLFMKGLSPSDKIRIGENLSFTAVADPGNPGSVCVMHQMIGGDVYYVVFVIQKTFGSITNTTKQIGQRMIEIDQTPFTLFDTTFKNSVINILKDFYAKVLTPNSNIYQVATTVVPETVDTSKIESVRVYIAGGISQTNALLQISAAITAEQIVQNQFVLTSNYVINPDSTEINVDGMLELSDFSINYTISARRQQYGQGNLLDQQRDNSYILAKVNGFIDFMPRPVPQQNRFMQQTQQRQPLYDPVFVVSHNSTLGVANNVADDTILTQILGLVSLIPMIQENQYRWVNIFEAFSNENSLSLGDFGYQENLWLAPNESFVPGSIPVLATDQLSFNRAQGQQTSMSPRTALELAMAYVSTNAIIALDVQLGSPLYRVQDILGNATLGSAEEDMVLRALDTFFDGTDEAGNKYIFSHYWKQFVDINHKPESIVLRGLNGEDTKTILHAGYYNADTGPRDLRSLRLLSVLRATKGQNSLLDDFVRARGYGVYSAEAIDHSRKNMLAFITHAKITGLTHRYYINPRFIMAIANFMGMRKIMTNVQGLNDMALGGYNTSAIQIAAGNLAVGAAGNFSYGPNTFNGGGNLGVNPGDIWRLK